LSIVCEGLVDGNLRGGGTLSILASLECVYLLTAGAGSVEVLAHMTANLELAATRHVLLRPMQFARL
jgi:hypothetical protein